MSVINPFTGREISLDSRRYRDVEKTGVLDMSICLNITNHHPKKRLEKQRRHFK